MKRVLSAGSLATLSSSVRREHSPSRDLEQASASPLTQDTREAQAGGKGAEQKKASSPEGKGAEQKKVGASERSSLMVRAAPRRRLGLRRRLPSRPDEQLKVQEAAAEFEAEARLRVGIRSACVRLRRNLYRKISHKLAEPANVVKLVAVGCIIWIWITTFGPLPVGLLRPDGFLCPRVTVCAETWHAMLLLGISRSGAYFCYPFIMLLFLTKTVGDTRQIAPSLPYPSHSPPPPVLWRVSNRACARSRTRPPRAATKARGGMRGATDVPSLPLLCSPCSHARHHASASCAWPSGPWPAGCTHARTRPLSTWPADGTHVRNTAAL